MHALICCSKLNVACNVHLQVELHVHADGSCRVSTLQELSRQYGLPYPHDNLEEFKEVVSLTTAAPSLAIFLSKFDAVLNILR